MWMNRFDYPKWFIVFKFWTQSFQEQETSRNVIINLFPHSCPISISFETYENPPTSTSRSCEQTAKSWSAVTFRMVPNCVVIAFLSLIPAKAKARSWMWRSWQRRDFKEKSSMFVFFSTNRRIPWNETSVRFDDSFRLCILFKFYGKWRGGRVLVVWKEQCWIDWWLCEWMGIFSWKTNAIDDVSPCLLEEVTCICVLNRLLCQVGIAI